MLIRTLLVLAVTVLLVSPSQAADNEQPTPGLVEEPRASAEKKGSKEKKSKKTASKKESDKASVDKKSDSSVKADTSGDSGQPASGLTASGQTVSSAVVLDPSRFFGAAAIGYAACKAVPDVAAKLFCYCGCDITDKHISLLDCFTSNHGIDCHICQEEVVLALKLHRDNTGMAEIQRIIDEKYSDQYPFEEDSPTYRKYKAGRLYKAAADSQAKSGGQISPTAAGPEAPGEKSAEGKKDKDWKPVVKEGKTVGKCCAGDHKEEKPGEKSGEKKEKK